MPFRKQKRFSDRVLMMPGIKHGAVKRVPAERFRHLFYGVDVTSSKAGCRVFIALQKGLKDMHANVNIFT